MEKEKEGNGQQIDDAALQQMMEKVVKKTTNLMKEWSDQDKLMEKAQQLLTEKYGKEITVERVTDISYRNSYYNVAAYCEDNPQSLFCASVELLEDKVTDGYVMRLVCDSLSQRVTDALGSIRNDFYIHTEADRMLLPLDDPETTLEQVVQEFPTNRYHIHLFLRKDLYDEENTLQYVKGLSFPPKLSGFLNLYQVEQEAMGPIVQTILATDILDHDFNEATEQYYFGFCKIEQGKIMSGSIFETIK